MMVIIMISDVVVLMIVTMVVVVLMVVAVAMVTVTSRPYPSPQALSGSRRLGCCSFSAWMASLCSCGPCSSRCRSSRSSRHSCCRTCWWATPNTKVGSH